MERTVWKTVMVAAIFASFYLLCGTAHTATAPQPFPDARGGDCAACHPAGTGLSPDHPETRKMNLAQCRACHDEDAPELGELLPLSHTHRLGGVACKACHGPARPPGAVETGTCLTCHPAAGLPEATRNHKPANPHDSHYGPELDCELCHHIHSASENYCNQCHEYDFAVP